LRRVTGGHTAGEGMMAMGKRASVADKQQVGGEVGRPTSLRTRSGKKPRPEEVIRLLRAWREGDEAEQRATLEYLKAALDEDRPSRRKLFP
jgi:hypothetical protein